MQGKKWYAALPPDVRKGYAFSTVLLSSGAPPLWGHSPKTNQDDAAGRSETLRTSGGKAATSIDLP
jgi:hypothetical protein